MKNVFIDTNILLSFFSYSTDHLNKLEELVELIKKKKVHLFISQQVVDEFNRNRDVKLKEVLKNLNTFSMDLKSPVVCHDLKEMKELQEVLSKASELKKKLIDATIIQIKSKMLKADKLINEIFSISNPISISEIIFNRARRRFDIGNPPGKNASYGDAINWEALLEVVPNSENLYFIVRDKDYVSAIDQNDFSSFLKDEWKTKKKSEIIYYDLLSKFLKDNFVETKITDEEVKDERTVAEQEPSSPLNDSYIYFPELQRSIEEFQRDLVRKWREGVEILKRKSEK